jgi:hypothetical protein
MKNVRAFLARKIGLLKHLSGGVDEPEIGDGTGGEEILFVDRQPPVARGDMPEWRGIEVEA